MSTIARFLRSFVRDEKGVTSIEYGLIAALIALVVAAAASGLGEQVFNTFNDVTVELGGTAAALPAN